MNDKRITQPIRQDDTGLYVGGSLIRKAAPLSYGGNNYVINPNAMLTINCTVQCNAKCFFCYNNLSFMCPGNYVDAADPELHRALEFAKRGGLKTVALSGGEPTLNPAKLIALVAAVKSYGFPIIRLHTNGYRLNEPITIEGRTLPLWKHLDEAGIGDISVSVADYRPDRNLSIMKLDTLSKLAETLPAMTRSGMAIRLSCYLCGAGIHTPEDVRHYLDFARANGVRAVILRKTPTAPQADLDYFDTLLRMLEADGWALRFSCQKPDALIYELEKEDFRLSFSCTSEEYDPDQKIRRLIYMPNKVVYTSWIDPSSCLFEQDIPAVAMTGIRAGQIPAPPRIHRDCGHTIDLHVHSQVSDGLDTPVQTLKKAAAAGIRQLVFAEHNCLHDSPELLRQAAAELGVELPLFGTELSTVFCLEGRPHMKFHLLVYGSSPGQLDFLSSLHNPNEPRNQHLRQLYENARQSGAVDVPWEDIYRIGDPGVPTAKKMFTRTPLARAIARTCGCTPEEAKETWLPPIDDARRYETYLDTAEMIRLAHENGCAAVLAHPGWIRPYHKDTVLTEHDLMLAITHLARAGLDGIEIVHRLNDGPMRQKLCGMAKALELVTTGGSDFHGKPRCVFGCNGTAQEDLDALVRRVTALRERAGIK